jgi:predicted TIM-barrel enzyme
MSASLDTAAAGRAGGSALGQGQTFLIGAAIGSGGMALAAERGGADFLLAINAGRLRSMGAPSIASALPIFDAARLTESFAREELLPLCGIPVLLGIDVWGEDFRPAERARAIAEAGFAGAVNFPSAIHQSRAMQQMLGRVGRGIEAEVAQLRAVQDAGLMAMFYCATRTQARLAADAGIELVCMNLGWNVGGAVGHRARRSVEEVALAVREIGRLIKRINPRTRFLLEGGPVATADDLGKLLRLAPLDGYVGGSTFERMPLEDSVADRIDRFRRAERGAAALGGDGSALVAWGRRYGFVGQSAAQVGFLRRLKSLAGGTAPVLLLSHPGSDLRPALQALAGPRSDPPNVFHVDLEGEDVPARARMLLFGSWDPNPRRRPALGDEAVELVVVHGAHRLLPGVQRRLARALSEGVFRPAGSRQSVPLRPRLVFSLVGPEIEARSAAAALDPELADALMGTVLHQPSLAARSDDLAELIAHLGAAGIADTAGGTPLDREAFSAEALAALHAHAWPHNEAELRGLVAALARVARDDRIGVAEIEPLLTREAGQAAAPARGEKDRIAEALWRHNFSRGKTAAALGISRKTLYNKIRKYGLAP